MKGLVREEGLSSEQIKRRLAACKIEAVSVPHDKHHPEGPYLLDTALEVRVSKGEVLEAIGVDPDRDHTSRPGITYFAYYKVYISKLEVMLDGKITFDNNRIVERTRIYSKK